MQTVKKGRKSFIVTTLRELLELARKDRTRKVTNTMYRQGATCFNGGIAKKLGLDPREGGWSLVDAVDKIRIPLSSVPETFKIPGPAKGKIGLGSLTVITNDTTNLSKRVIATTLMKALKPSILDRKVKIEAPQV